MAGVVCRLSGLSIKGNEVHQRVTVSKIVWAREVLRKVSDPDYVLISTNDPKS